MKRLLLSKTVFAIMSVLFLQTQASAQNQPLNNGGSIKTNLVNARFIVNNPVSIAGLKKVTLAPWGGQITTPYINVPVAKGLDSLAAAALTNPTVVAGKFALLYRGGGITFVDKALRAQAAGATGLIIVNNIPGDPVGMGGTTTAVTIPVVMVSDVDGNAINTQLRNSLAVNVSLGGWGLGQAHDLAILKGYASAPHALNIPYSMWTNSVNNPFYKNWVGGAIENFGTATETNVTVSDSVIWVPTGSSVGTTEKQDSYIIASIAPIDSIKFGFGNAASSYWFTPKPTTGRYDYYSRISYANTDGVPQDNVSMYSQYINDSIFCKGDYDYVKGQPVISGGIRPNQSASPYIMGPMFFSTRANYAARKIQFSIFASTAASQVGDTLENVTATATLLKWVDGANGGTVDGDMEGSEIDIVGYTIKSFTASDTSGRVVSVDVLDPSNPTGKRVVLDSNAWYWVGIQIPVDNYIGTDKNVSYFTRAYIESQNLIADYPEAMFIGDVTGIAGQTGIGVTNFPFGGSGNVDSVNFDKYTQIPSVALHISKTAVGTNTAVNNISEFGSINVYPNPTTGGSFTVNLKLNNTANKVTYRLIDGLGRLVTDVVHNNVKAESFQYNTKGLSSGNYYLIVMDDKSGSLLQKIAIQ